MAKSLLIDTDVIIDFSRHQLEEIFYREPFRPFFIILAEREVISVVQPRKALVSGEILAVDDKRGIATNCARFFRELFQ